MTINVNAFSNIIMDNGVRTYHGCARCAQSWSRGDFRFLGRHGCIMLPVSEEADDAVKEWREEGISSCLRCWAIGQPCVALPKELTGDLDRLDQKFAALEANSMTDTIENPDYATAVQTRKELIEAAKNSAPGAEKPQLPLLPPKTISSVLELSPAAKSKIEESIRSISTSMAGPLSRAYTPHAKYLWLHNGALVKAESPQSSVRPLHRDRSNAARNAAAEASKVLQERRVAQEVEAATASASTPRKRKRNLGVPDVNPENALREEIVVKERELAEAETARADSAGNAKAALTRKIKALKEKLTDLKAKL